MNLKHRVSAAKDKHEFFRLAPAKKKRIVEEVLSRPDYNIAEYVDVRSHIFECTGFSLSRDVIQQLQEHYRGKA